jgi:hypothetical protein
VGGVLVGVSKKHQHLDRRVGVGDPKP